MAGTSGREIKRHRLHQDIVKYLLGDIRNGVYKVGDFLPSERDLMAEFQVGRPSIRESLMQLSQMGLIELRPGVRAKVREPSVVPALDGLERMAELQLRDPRGSSYFLEARMLFEAAAARRSALLISEAQLKDLERILEEKERCTDQTEKFAELDVLFHKRIVEVLGNSLLNGIYDAMGRWLLDQRLQTLKVDGQPQRALEAHSMILDALRRHDADAAEKAMESHIRQIGGIYAKTLAVIEEAGK